MPHFCLHNSGLPGDILLSRTLIQAIAGSFPGVGLTLEVAEPSAYLWQDLALPIQCYAGESYNDLTPTPTCPPDAVFLNLGFGVFADLLTLYGMTYTYYVHAYNRQIGRYHLQHRYLLPLPLYSPMVTFPNQGGQSFESFVVQPNGIFVENSTLPGSHNYFYLNEHLNRLAGEFPHLTFYCSAAPITAAENLVDCSGMNLVELSWLSDRCVGLLTRGGDVNAATYTEANRLKPRCIVGWDLPLRLWQNTTSTQHHATTYEQVRAFLHSLIPPSHQLSQPTQLVSTIAPSATSPNVALSPLPVAIPSPQSPPLPAILLVSHPQQQCGVHQYGVTLANTLKTSQCYGFHYAECSNVADFLTAVQRVQPAAIIYNYYPSTLPWVTRELLDAVDAVHIGIIHEVTQQVADGADDRLFQYHIAPDPTIRLNNPIVFKTGRIVLPYDQRFPLPEIPTIGSFGFGLAGKGFERVITTVQEEFDEAIIRLHIPFAAFGDASGYQAMAIAQYCQTLVTKPGIHLKLSHDFLSQQQLLDFLAQNTVNAFFYAKQEGRGISSVIDHALAVQRPIAVSRSTMFRHILSATPSICIEDTSLRQIIEQGFAPLVPFYEQWQPANLVGEYEAMLAQLLQPVEPLTLATAPVTELEHQTYQGVDVALFQTPTGMYWLPTNLQTDVIINTIKAGKVFEPEIIEAAKPYLAPGKAVIDVGTSFGQMTVLFSQLVGEHGKVYAIEADSFQFGLLEKNLSANGCRNVIPICKAAYDEAGKELAYPIPDFTRFGSYGSYGLAPDLLEGRTVETITIDSLPIQDPISFLKVDAQGSDLFVLKGAIETIKRHQMPILFEYEEQFQAEFHTSLADYMQFINAIDYQIKQVINDINYLIVPKESQYMSVGVSGVTGFNRILDNQARSLYKPVIDQLFTLLPAMMARKIPEANVQQAFVLDTVQKFASQFTRPKVLCVGSFEDTAAEGLKQLGYLIEEIDPLLNFDLDSFFHQPSTIKGSYDIIFSTSVLEHVPDDELFMGQIAELLAPNGVAILTCDYNDQYKPGDPIPREDCRFYTQRDFQERILPLLKDCAWVDTPQWDCPQPDFTYAGCHYTFATLVFRKAATASVPLPVTLGEVNVILFPDWSASEEALGEALHQVFTQVLQHPDRSRLCLLVYQGALSEEDVSLLLSGAMMQALITVGDEVDSDTDLMISLVGWLGTVQCQTLMTRLQARISLTCEDNAAIAQFQADQLPLFSLV